MHHIVNRLLPHRLFSWNPLLVADQAKTPSKKTNKEQKKCLHFSATHDIMPLYSKRFHS